MGNGLEIRREAESGEEALAAVGTSDTVMYFCLALAMGFSAGNGVIVSQAFGAKDEKTMRAGASRSVLHGQAHVLPY